MAGAYVFPGGQVDEEDSHLSDYIRTPENFDPRARLQDQALELTEAISLYVCAIRETFEETGVLLAKTGDGQSIEPECGIGIEGLAPCRSEICLGKKTLKDIARQENLFFPLADLIPYAHWITPEIVQKRFSTRFFLARLPDGQKAATDAVEMTDDLWVTPHDALRMHFAKDILLMPPTLKTLEEMSAFAGIEDLFAAATNRIIYPILPQPTGNILKLPHDPEYDIEQYKVPPRPGETSRFIFIDGIWQTAFYEAV
jgi:8-oxo-dGTP pyrophosphatase MutT (NUDIX family)